MTENVYPFPDRSLIEEEAARWLIVLDRETPPTAEEQSQLRTWLDLHLVNLVEQILVDLLPKICSQRYETWLQHRAIRFGYMKYNILYTVCRIYSASQRLSSYICISSRYQ